MGKLQEAKPSSDYRCQSDSSDGQCPYLSMEGMVREGENFFEHTIEVVEGVKCCPKHGGMAQVEKKRQEQISVYKINGIQDKINNHIQSGQIKNLRNEIGLTRYLIEETANKALANVNGKQYGLEIVSPKLERLIARVESLVTSCQRIEDKSESQLDVTEANKFAANLVKVAMRFVPEDKYEEFADEIEKLMF